MSEGASAPTPNNAPGKRAAAPARSAVTTDERAGAARSDVPLSGNPTGPAGVGDGAARWRTRRNVIVLDRPFIAGILNVTPDSFSDGGWFTDPVSALVHARQLLREGADMLDVGGESTRPQGAVPVDVDEESQRVVPVIRAVRAEFPDIVISVDTVKSEVARRALDAGADIVNDVSAFRLDSRMAETCAAAGAGVILMHSRGAVSDMATYVHADYDGNVVAIVRQELQAAMELARSAGVHDECMVLDPGVGFSKRSEHSLQVLAGLPLLLELGRPLMVGVSRKRFIGELNEVAIPAERVFGTVGANVAALWNGARIFRVHDVRENRQALDVAWAVMQAGAL